MNTRCPHTRIKRGPHYGFQAPVAIWGRTDENPAAHGGVTYTERCLDCLLARHVNANGNHHEYSPWSLRTGLLLLAAEEREREDRRPKRQIGWGGLAVGAILERPDYRRAEELERRAANAT